ncbi:hypothetical protein OIU74_024319 [Salix koriyanagi]|uniref:Uncharacterized protein n=1 Tax=Salix koriyanagi TaxID=2511006 RepID=A0A9Q0W6K0_9ROSI|nr:hypothetical protein OIU74_024319 [Salix koriyanagi]
MVLRFMGIHIGGVSVQNLLRNDSVCPFRWVEWVPKCIDVTVRAQV